MVYYHLLTSNTSLTPEQLDNKIEVWMEKKFDSKIDFDIDGPLKNLAQIKGKIISDSKNEDQIPDVSLLRYDENGCCQVLSIDNGKKLIDHIWDNLFIYT
ncbi:MAG: hypothetical protein O4861_00675 [Trichodesmium sp. St16_bin4-tuft]|nr:hypothetical protein [Trichodesmium sp. St2_bin6]MDE5096932.1 hypothetical protein [Trichodesmium sp. St16_bin4-tuft]